MQYMTISEYARHIGVKRQSVQDRIRRGTLATVRRVVRVPMTLIPVETKTKKRK